MTATRDFNQLLTEAIQREKDFNPSYHCGFYKNIREGRKRFYHKDGTYEEQQWEQGELRSRQIWWHGGVCKSSENYYQGQLQGMTRRFSPEGKPLHLCCYVAGKKDGSEMNWYDGKCHITNWENDLMHGVEAILVDDEQNPTKIYTCDWYQGAKHGKECRYRDGKKVYICAWKYGLKNGLEYNYETHEATLWQEGQVLSN